MGRFFKWVMASCLGTILAFLLLFAILMVVGMVADKGSKTKTSGTFLTLDLNRAIPELTDNVQQNASFSLEQKKALGIHDIRRVLQKASGDATVKGLVLKSTMVGDIGQAKTSTLIKYLKEFKDSGKPIYAYGDYAGQSEYLMMSVADSVFINPQGAVDLRGFSRMIPFYKDLFEKLGVEWNVFYVGDYKSATEPYLKTSMSDKAKLQSRQYLDDFQQIYYDSLEVNRDIDRARLLTAQDDYAIRYAEDALEHNLVDDLLYWEDFIDVCKRRIGVDLDKKIKLEDITTYFVNSGMKSKKRGKDKIAVLFAEGVIEYQTPGPGNISEVDYHTAFNEIDDADVKALVLRVNSPGGNAFSSEQIWHRVERIKAAGIPVVASYGNYAASGGYYISCNADTIVSQPNTITGSIGVFGMFPDASELLNDKLGVYFDTVKTSPYAVAASPFFKLRDDEKEVVQSSVEKMYDLFLTRVSDGRGMSKDAVHEVAQGRVWSGLDAVDKGLVDVVGDLDDAIAIAAEMAGIEDSYGIKNYPSIEEDFFTKIITQMNAQTSLIKTQPMSRVEKQVMDQYKMLKQVMQYQEPQFLMPYYTE